MKTGKLILLVMAMLASGASVMEAVTLPPVISRDMVLQQGRICPVWGEARPGETVTVSFRGQQVSAKADVFGRWAVQLQPMTASAEGATLAVCGEHDTLRLANVVVGEVWICSGQSNMQYSMVRYKTFKAPKHGPDLQKEEMKRPANPAIRVFLSDRGHSWRQWRVASPESLPDITAAGYFFAKRLHEVLGVPVGIVSAALGGQRIETWTDVEAFRNDSACRQSLDRRGQVNGLTPGQWYETLIAPLTPLAVKGFLWYQGESNCVARERSYARKYKVLTDSWRRYFNAPDAPFYSVLLAPHVYSKVKHSGGVTVAPEELPRFWQQQMDAVKGVKNNDMICISDLVDTLTDIHPPYKWEVGRRLANMALDETYGQHLPEPLSPRIDRVETDGQRLNVTFTHVAKGLKSRDNRPLDWFEVAGSDGRFCPAEAVIKGKDRIVVRSKEVKTPRFLRFAWHEEAMPNLVNSEGLPAFPYNNYK